MARKPIHRTKGGRATMSADPDEKNAANGELRVLKEEIAKLQVNLRGYANQTPARPKSNGAKRQRPPRNRGKRRR